MFTEFETILVAFKFLYQVLRQYDLWIFFVSTSNTNLQFKSKYLRFTSYNPIVKVRTARQLILFTVKKTRYLPN